MRKGISLHIGINRYDKVAYKPTGFIPQSLPNCHADALANLEIAKKFGFNCAALFDREATVDIVTNGIRSAADYLEDGDIFFISFSGHGSRLPDTTGDEDDGYDEIWCLYDRPLLDDDLFQMLKRFRPGVRILLIADSCHSGTSAKYLNHGSCKTTFPLEKTNDIQATCLLMAACQDDQSASPGNNIDYSLYTYWMLKVLERYEFCESYRELHNRIAANMPASSKPGLFPFGPNAGQFLKTRPFRV